MTSRRTLFSQIGNMMTSKQSTATTTDAGIAARHSHNIGPDGPILLQERYPTEQRWPIVLYNKAPEEVGVDPDAFGSPRSAAVSILLWFTLGAVIMVLPYTFGTGLATLGFAIASACGARAHSYSRLGRTRRNQTPTMVRSCSSPLKSSTLRV
jgi:VIT1/CCC1 family predicted Fe2+/Mn2+ transporter